MSVESIKDELIDLTLREEISEQDFYKISSVLLHNQEVLCGKTIS